MPTSTNPHIKPGELIAARQDMAEAAFAQEFEADFLGGEGSVFPKIRAAIVTWQFQPAAGHQCVIGCDWGKINDFSVFVVIDKSTKIVVEVMRSNKVDYVLQRGRLMALRDKWKPVQCIVEANSIGGPIIEQLQRDGLARIYYNERVKSEDHRGAGVGLRAATNTHSG